MNQNTDDIKEIKRILIAIGRSNSAIERLSKSMATINNMSSARWQVLSAIHHIQTPTISSIARALKSTRQNISVLIDSMKKEGLVVEKDNPKHKRSKIQCLTENGLSVLIGATKQRDIWCESIGTGISVDELKTARIVLQKLTKTLENNNKV